jgi:hypothetical protein
MNRILLVGAIVLLAGCAAPIQPQTATPPPPPSPPEILHTLTLASPPGQGTVELTREALVQAGAETVTYRARGTIVTTDDIGQWRFAYTKTSLEGAATNPTEWIVGLHAISLVVISTSPGPLEVDWEHSVFVDPSGRSQRMIHRGIQLNQKAYPMAPSIVVAGATLNEFVFPSDGITFSAPGRASLWSSPALLERLAPGSGFSIVLSVKSGEVTASRTFRFSAGAPR